MITVAEPTSQFPSFPLAAAAELPIGKEEERPTRHSRRARRAVKGLVIFAWFLSVLSGPKWQENTGPPKTKAGRTPHHVPQKKVGRSCSLFDLHKATSFLS
jgi:hypothetical protein